MKKEKKAVQPAEPKPIVEQVIFVLNNKLCKCETRDIKATTHSIQCRSGKPSETHIWLRCDVCGASLSFGLNSAQSVSVSFNGKV